MNEETKEPENQQGEILTDENTYTESNTETTTSATSDDKTAQLQADLADAKDKYLRLYADFENFRRRTAKEKVEMIQTASEGVLKDLIVILDDFERASKNFPTEPAMQSVKEGYELIYHKFKKTLESKGLKDMEVKQGDAFDTEKHEAITQFTAPSEELKGKVIDVAEKGYVLGEKVVRFAKVVVGI